MKKRNLLSTTFLLAIICVAILGITSSFSDLGSEQASIAVLSDDTGTDTDTDTGSGTDTDDSGSAPEPGMVFDKPVSKPITCAAQSVTWTKSYTAGGSLISWTYSNGKVVKGPSWGSTVSYTITGSAVIDQFNTDWIKCENKWSWGCEPCPPTDACTVGCG
ncbi:hypothetical protein LWM68_28890 [Niabella sp. W65]|nr:hypothetical protein [Niabella sp. W65]MCH7366432.1 hypothetical protein [Niabella sp. W65]ULT42152.1 hypothetical protein KRR40_00345 [Niabella sp. I65]